MNFRILGPLEVRDEERIVDLGGGKQRALFALLLLHANEVLSSDRLIDELWPAEPPPSAAKIIQIHVSRLRKALDGAGDGVLLTRGRGYELRVRPGELDLDRFRALLEEGRASLAADDPTQAGRTLRQALDLWRGPPLAEFAYDSFAQEEIARLDELHLAALEERFDADLAVGRHEAVIPELEQLVQRHPLRERLRGQLMLALYRAGRQVEALEVYRDARRTLAAELGLEPSPTLQQLERSILSHDARLQTAPRQSSRRSRRPRALLIGVAALALVATTIVVGLVGRSDSATLSSLTPDSVGVIDPHANAIADEIPVGATPTRIAFGAGAVWVISEHDKTITRIDPQTSRLRTVTVGGPPIDVTADAAGVWLLVSSHSATAGGSTRVVPVDPTMGDTLPRIPVGAGPFGFGSKAGGGNIAAAGGTVWVVNVDPQLVVARIDATNRVKTLSLGGPTFAFDSGTAGGVPGASGVAHSDGALWVGTNSGVSRINVQSMSVSATIPLGVLVPVALAADHDAIWVAARPGFRCCPPESVGTGTLTRINARTNSVDATIPIGGEPAAIAVGEGAVWIADRATRSIVRVDPETNRVVKRIALGARPRGVAAGGGLIWVSVG